MMHDRERRTPASWSRVLLIAAIGFVACEHALGFEHPNEAPEVPPSGGSAGAESEGGRVEPSGGRPGAPGGSVPGTSDAGAGAAPRGGVGGHDPTSAAGAAGRESVTGGGGASGFAGAGAAAGAAGASGGCRTPLDCDNPDPDHCVVECVRSGAERVCLVRGSDADADEHSSSSCAVAPGDDCEDSRPDIHSDRTEICDGADNDCDGKSDLDDGLAVSAAPVEFASRGASPLGGVPQIAWSPAEQLYAVTWRSGPPREESLYFQTWDAAGAAQTLPVLVNEGLPGAFAEAVAWGAERFGVAWISEADEQLYFREVGADGALHGDPIALSDPGDFVGEDHVALASLAGGDWIATWRTMHAEFGVSLVARRFSRSGALEPQRVLDGPNPETSVIAIAGDSVLLLWSSEYDRSAAVFDAHLINSIPLAQRGSRRVIAAGTDSFGLASLEEGDDLSLRLRFSELAANGVTRCGPVDVPADGFVPGTMARSTRGFVIFGANSWEAVEVLDGCRFGSRFQTGARASDPRVAASGDHGFGVVWHELDATGTPGSLRRLLMGANFCD